MIFKTLQFLLLYIRYDTDSNQARVRDSNDRMVLNYLAVTSVRLLLSSPTQDGSILTLPDAFVLLRYLSSASLIDYRCSPPLAAS